MQHDPRANTQVTEVTLPAALTEPLPDDASTATIVARTAAETTLGVPGVHHLGGIAARAADQLRKQLGRSAGTAGVQVDEQDGVLAVQVAVVVSYPHPVLDVAAEVRQQVTAATQQLSDLRTSVDVRVLDVHGPFDDEQSPLGRAADQATDAVEQATESTGDTAERAAETAADAADAADTAADAADDAAVAADAAADAAAAPRHRDQP
ncbi:MULTISPECIES: Asp23/Gls24 family envelope stress response protein [Curtobacterium]|uniref:Asp23/Gls24 family envelope stress response protein n=1 Tax=Curtobacterium TaxID=2034 RepID=UPI00217DCE1D|nr:Asp23/Gls24 family envelope stress response protein [Curtobacterium flaccumfaciens]MCS6562591.1 Asp23/Gls24 family envelope stress response protein [Curtobacterium flaccumfaciens pv. poinsettiae]UXN28637.1 Asp23/Gls24 family envelope stress response protein [Curtobacterium flaccumfaciens]